MFSKVNTFGIQGVESCRITAEADLSDGLPAFRMVGNLSEETREAQERVRTALKNSGFSIPPRKITINLSPAGVRKYGTSFDCAIALAILCCLGVLEEKKLENYAFFGELALDGSIRPVRGILPGTLVARKEGYQAVFVPEDNVREASVADGMKVIGIRDLKSLAACLQHENPAGFAAPEDHSWQRRLQEENGPDFSDLSGLPSVRLAAMAAAAGNHNILFIGPAGTGKTMAASRIPSILPPMEKEESIEVSKLYSICGLLNPEYPLITKRPFRAPHHSITATALIGGGYRPQPGEISLASGGVLFLDELPEFPPRVLDQLRQPMEEKQVIVNRLSGTERYPADFLLVCAMNPCKCGFYPDLSRCRCTVSQRRKYLAGISGPFLDRIDIGVEVPLQKLSFRKMKKKGESSAVMREKVLRAIERQERRFSGLAIRRNSRMTGEMLEDFCPMAPEAECFLEQYLNSMDISMRGAEKTIRLSRTLADLDGREIITKADLAQALMYRSFFAHYWRREG